jgi:hypothetical protein
VALVWFRVSAPTRNNLLGTVPVLPSRHTCRHGSRVCSINTSGQLRSLVPSTSHPQLPLRSKLDSNISSNESSGLDNNERQYLSSSLLSMRLVASQMVL